MKRLCLVLTICVLLTATSAHAGWWQTFGGTNTDIGSCVQQTADGGYIVAGSSSSFGGMWLIKLGSLGKEEWSKTYGDSDGLFVRQTSDGGYIFSGWTQIVKTDVNGDTLWAHPSYRSNCIQQTESGNFIVAGQKVDDFWIYMLDETGDSLWALLYEEGNYESQARYVEQTSDGDYIVVGSITDTIMEESGPRFKSHLWLLKINDAGDTVWTRLYESDEWDVSYYGRCVRQTSDGGYIIIGSWLMKTDENGDSTWTRTFGGSLYCVEQTLDEGYIVIGGSERATYTSTLEPTGGNLWLIKTDENGDTIWTREYGGDETDAGRYVQQTSDSGYIVIGYTISFGAGTYDLYLLKTDSLGLLGISEESEPQSPRKWEMISLIGQVVSLSYSDAPQGFHASVYDALGRKVDELHSSNRSGVITWGMGYSPGVYFIKDNNLNQTTTSKVVLIK